MILKRCTWLFMLAALVILSGCTVDMVCALTGHKTGDTVGVVSRSTSHITLVYTHSYAEELPAASQMADNWCRENGGNRAVLVQNTRNNLDRSTKKVTDLFSPNNRCQQA